ncbi:MAG: rhodanese-like domain-containing protein [Dehalococcoidales bacterium]|nr:rhodanese-like domain-containing protein [Dehalococcoidales bacterium]
MKKFRLLSLTLLITIGIILPSGCTSNETSITIIEDITPENAFTLIQDNPDIIIIDVRTPREFEEEHIENAININFYSSAFIENLKTLDKNKTYLVYCAIGVRSSNAVKIMADIDFTKTYNLLGGIKQWKSQGLPTAN